MSLRLSPNRRGRPLGKMKDRVEEYLGEGDISGREVLQQARRESWQMGSFKPMV